MVFQTKGSGAGEEPNRGQLLAKSVVQFLTEAFLFAIADFENLTLQTFAPANLVFQFGVSDAQRSGALLNKFFQRLFRFLQRGLGLWIECVESPAVRSITTPTI